jgi:hypothetical protein
MAFLLLSVALLPFSMKAVGFGINLGPRVCAVVDAWTEVAGVFVVGYHPFSVASWSALNNLNSSDSPESVPESGEQCSLIAQLYSIGSGEDCGLTTEPVQLESTPEMEARSVAPQVMEKTPARLNARRAGMSGPALIAEVMTVKAENDDLIIKVPANLPAVAMRFVRTFNSRPVPAARPKFKRAEREAFKAEAGRFLREARFEKGNNMTFEFSTGATAKSERIECDVDQLIKGAESLEKLRRVRVIEAESVNTHEL